MNSTVKSGGMKELKFGGASPFIFVRLLYVGFKLTTVTLVFELNLFFFEK